MYVFKFCILVQCMIMDMRRGRVKGKPDAVISLLFSKSINGTARLNFPIRRRNHHQRIYAFTLYALQRDLGLNSDIFCPETIPLNPREKYFIINSYSSQNRTRDRCTQGIDSAISHIGGVR